MALFSRKINLKSLSSHFLASLFLLAPLLIVFKNIFLFNIQPWGDAPFFWDEGLKDIFNEPLGWTQRGINFGGINLFLSLSPIMFIYGALGKFINLSSNQIVIILFYIPSIILSLVSSILLTRYLKLSLLTQFFAAAVYLFNTYFLLLVDGGQVGVALAYSFFPLAILFVKEYLDNSNTTKFIVALLFLFLTSVADARVAIISLITIFTWETIEVIINREASKYLVSLKSLGILLVGWIFVSAYWIYPLIKNNAGGFGNVLNLQLTSILHPLFLFSPHWPGNLFGKVSQPFWYFTLIPILVLFSLFFTKQRRNFIFVILFLIFAFISKGNTPILGNWYDILVNLPFGFAFRDSSKFFIPVIVFASILIGESVSVVSNKFKDKKIFGYFFSGICYLYILFLVSPTFVGELNFVLSSRSHSNDYKLVYENLKQENSFVRSAWFPERHPMSFNVKNNFALDANTFVGSRPFANMNAGEDWHNFLYTPDFVEWFRVLGIKYLILSDDPRSVKKDEKEQKDWDQINILLSQNPELNKVNWGTNFPVYKVENTLPKFYAVEKLYAVVGPSFEDENLTLPAIYFEDGKWDPTTLEGLDKESVKIYFNGKEQADLVLSFLQKYFVNLEDNKFSQWSIYPSGSLLKAKYELLIRGIEYKDFDYQKGISFSTQKDQQIGFTFKVPDEGSYSLAVRLMANKDSLGVENVDTGVIYDTGTIKRDHFVWILEDLGNLEKGNFEVSLRNRGGTTVINTVALIPKEELDKADAKANVFIDHFGRVNTNQIDNSLTKETNLNIEEIGTLKYKFDAAQNNYWLILNENYHPLWQLRRGIEYFKSVPVYSMINGFYAKDSWGNLGIEFRGQENVRWGIYISTVSILLIAIFYLFKKDDSKKDK